MKAQAITPHYVITTAIAPLAGSLMLWLGNESDLAATLFSLYTLAAVVLLLLRYITKDFKRYTIEFYYKNNYAEILFETINYFYRILFLAVSGSIVLTIVWAVVALSSTYRWREDVV